MSDEIMGTEVTEAVQPEAVESQDVKTFTQDEVDRIVADRIARQQRQFDKKLDGIDINEVRDLMTQREHAQVEEQKNRGDYENLIKQMSDKHSEERAALKGQLERTLVDGSLLTAASKLNAVSPDQVSALLRSSVTLSEDNTVEVFDKNGTPRYNDSGNLLSVNELVAEFLTANPHFVKASSGGAGSSGSAGGSTSKPLSYSEMLEKGDEGMRLFREQKMRDAAR